MNRWAIHNDAGIWFTGSSQDTVINEYLDELRATREEVELYGPILVAPMTARLSSMVERYGYDANRPAYSYCLRPDGTLDLDDQTA
jgi:hypothetical protein